MSLESMTAYSQGEIQIGNAHYKIQMKSVNNRFLELKWRAPRSFMSFEVNAKEWLRNSMQRGSFEVWIEAQHDKKAEEANGLSLFFSKLGKALEQSKSHGISDWVLPAPVRAMILSRYPDLWLNQEDTATITQEDFEAWFKKIMQQHRDVRLKEGEAIRLVLLENTEQLENNLSLIAEMEPKLREEWKRQIEERWSQIKEEWSLNTIPEEKLAIELAQIVEKRDVSEEKDRIRIHLGELKKLLNKQSSVKDPGKRIDFLIQELHREWTTLGNKIKDADAAKVLIDSKLLLEKIREQSMNLV